MFPHPEFNIFGIDISAYSLLSVVGMLFCVAVFYGLARYRKMLKDDLFYMSLSAIIGLLVGAHILFGITRIPATIDEIKLLSETSSECSFNTVLQIIFENWNGMVFYGGLLGAIFAITAYCRKNHLDTFRYMDLYVPIFPLFHAFGRVGCFFAGCCYGIECSIGYTHTHTNGYTVTRFPVQLLEAGLNLMLLAAILFLFFKGKAKGRLLPVYLLVYSVIRFCDEFLRGDEIRGKFLVFSTSQWISILLFAVAIILFLRPQWLRPVFYRRSKKPKTARE
ncbi:MAG: prolipoprotein diacylglyceryl transferase [Clostridia bacterium]|nr:prolipoprotein diacylglyceryl transferase [Clostridia bacterium]